MLITRMSVLKLKLEGKLLQELYFMHTIFSYGFCFGQKKQQKGVTDHTKSRPLFSTKTKFFQIE